MAQVSFDVPEDALPHIQRIVKRAGSIRRKHGIKFDRLSCEMDLCATHANGCPMDFDRLAAADDFNVAHDVFGIERHIDRRTGKLTGFFLPRFASKAAKAS